MSLASVVILSAVLTLLFPVTCCTSSSSFGLFQSFTVTPNCVAAYTTPAVSLFITFTGMRMHVINNTCSLDFKYFPFKVF